MTLIQPNKEKHLLNMILAILILAVFSTALGLVYFYNQSINLEHNLSSLNDKISAYQAKSAALDNEIFSLSSDNNIKKLAAENNFVEDKQPQYFSINHQLSLSNH